MKKAGQKQEKQPVQRIVMVCVTRQRTCARLIEQGEAIAVERELPLHVVHAVKTGENFLGNALEGEALEFLFKTAQLSNAELTVLRSDDVEKALLEYARTNDAAVLVLGSSPETGSGSSFADRLQGKLPNTELMVVG